MEPTTPNKGGRPKKVKSLRGITPKQKTAPKCILGTKKRRCQEKSTERKW